MMEIVSRAEAKERGLKHYFTGCPCRYGHVDRRFTADGGCMSCSRIKLQIKYKIDPASERARSRKRRIDHPDRVRASQRKLLEKDPGYFRSATSRYESRLREDRDLQDYIDALQSDGGV